MSAEMQATAALVLLAIVALAVVMWLLGGRRRPLAPVTEWPPAPADRPTFAAELAAIDVPAGPNYTSGEWPLVEAPSVEVVEVVEVVEPAEPAEHVARHAAAERVLSDARPWLAPALHQEATPFFWATGELPTYDVDQLSATHAWASALRSELLERLGMEAEEAA